MSEKDNLFEESKEAYDTVDEKVGEVTGTIDKINMLSDIWAYTQIYNSSESTDEMKRYASIQIINNFALIAGDNISPEDGGSYFSVFDSNYVNDAIDICSKEDFKIQLYNMGCKAIINGDPNADIYYNMYINIDESYEAYKIAIEECCKNDFPTTKTQWDMFYKNYQENNDPEEIFDNMNSWLDDLAEKFGLYDDSTTLGHLMNLWSDFLCNRILNAPERWTGYFKKKGKDVYEYLNNDSSLSCSSVKIIDLKNIKSHFSAASHVRYDPIMLDLDGDGFNIETKKNGTNFDLDNNGFAEKINWTRKDGFLCLDLNGNGVIDNGGELFGDNTLLADGTKAPNGFEALAQYDSNGDGIIDKNDAVFDSLRIWVDPDGNGISSEGELKSLSELGIIGIRLDYTELNGETGTEAILGNGASFIREDGTESAAAELWVSSDLYDTTETIDVEISEEIAKLPDVRSIGNAYSLHTALALDETGTLKGYVETFINSKSSAEKWQTVDNILYFICGAENIDSESKGGIIDAKQLAVLETMLGEKFVGMNGENPNAAAAPILEEAYRNIAEMYYSSLCIQTSIKDYAALLRYTENEDGTKALNADLLNLVMDYELSNGGTEFNQKLYDLAIYVKQLDNCGINGLNAFIIHYAGISYDYAEMMTEIISNGYKANGISNLIGTTNADLLLGSESSEIIKGNAGNDIIIGGKGDDTLYGGAGDDTYIFNIGDGNDIISEEGYNSSNDTVRFGEGITADDITISRSIHDMVISYSENDSVTLSNVYSNSKYWVNNIEFADGTRLSIEDLFERSLTISGSGKITDFTSGFGNRNSTIIGSETADQIYGYDGNDIIIGGKGDDTLYGGAGDDTYIFNIGDGNDIISEEGYNSSNDTVRFGEGITADDITISRSIHDMVISYSENDSVTLSNVYSNSKYWVNNIEFADGTRLSIEDLFERSLTISGSGKITDFTSGFGNRNSTIIGSETADQIYGYDGNDTIIGGKGDDILYGGAGDDTYIFNIGDGNDIINEQGYGSSNDTVLFGEEISVNDIQFGKSGNDLAISFAGSDDLLTIISQFSNSKYAVENFTTSDGYSISSNQIDLLIQAMASFEADSGMTWNEAVENNNKRAADIINEMWIKTA